MAKEMFGLLKKATSFFSRVFKINLTRLSTETAALITNVVTCLV